MADSNTPEAISSDEFTDSVIGEYLDLYAEIQTGERAEHDLMPRLIDHLFVNILDFSKADYEQEDEWNDIRFFDEDRNPVIIVEGKRRDVEVEEGIEQVFRYASGTPYVRFLVSTNIDNLLLYERCPKSHPDAITHYGISARKIAEVPFEGIANRASGQAIANELTLDERQAILQLKRLRKSEITHEDRYSEFDIVNRQDVDTDEGFDNLLQTLATCLEDYFIPYTLAAFDHYEERYQEFERERQDLEAQIKRLKDSGHDDSEIADLESQLADLRDEYEIYEQFNSDYETWVRLSNRQDTDYDENKEVFCRESVYVQLNKILLIRIAEDKDLTNRMISNGGVDDYFAFWNDYTRYVSRNYVDLFELASEELGEIYDHLYTRRIFDWELRDDPDLDNVIQRTLWHLNHFDFSDVDRDVLGHLYQEHLPPEERKALGEFYTPTAVVDLILDSVGYTSDKQLEKEEYDLLDPACGSGTFLVRAAKRLLDRLDQKGVPPRDAIEIVRERLHGFDLNPFATHIAEMNLLFQVIDLYREVKEEDPEYTLDRFHIYQTDSLRRENQESLTALHSSAVQRRYREERRQANEMKTRKDYGFVVGNPPYVRIQNIPKGPARDDYDEFHSAHYNYDLYILFIERAGDWLAEGGELGFITSNKFIRNRYGEKIRDYIIQNYKVEELINFGDISVFPTVQSYPIILVGQRINKEERARSPEEFKPDQYAFTYATVRESLPEITQTALNGATGDEKSSANGGSRIADIIRSCLPETPGGEPPSEELVLERLGNVASDVEANTVPLDVFPVESLMLSDGDWRFVPADEGKAMRAIEAGGDEFGSFAGAQAMNGAQTGANDVFVIDSATVEEWDMEEEIVKPLVTGEDIHRWHTEIEDEYLIYTTPDLDLDEYPRVKAYLESNREELQNRYAVQQGKNWYQLARHRPGTFDRKKVVSPDICYYSNFWLDDSEEVTALNTAYCLWADSLDGDYLTGIFNSNAVQFYMRRSAPKYSNNYMRYQRDYLLAVPIPNPEENESEQTELVIDTAKKLKETTMKYRRAQKIREHPESLLEDVDTESLSYTEYIMQMDFDNDDADVSPSHDGVTVRLNVQDSIEFIGENCAAAFVRLLNALDVGTVGELRKLEVPVSAEELSNLMKSYHDAELAVNELAEEAISLEKELNGAVYELYGLGDEVKRLIEERVDRPSNPLESKVRG
ncbi:N-6 DNA methylase [Haloferax sp. MBLA0076]|uniref:site-specific DNA-methyltransferase (adenine-specific) n=1 Tax=Haloferax litoreum TaxID=2666140 RepID=A0A6A8GG71_9EURY|nr:MULTISPECIES: N-6 DNA methylase [Haloferax]KAB1193368.1 N-6 DNA methylase [Haloferax sp. CBA1148]MRX21876.1 N-6 DNA methylase [Haloferax litoreum]